MKFFRVLKVAVKTLAANKARSFLMMLGIIIGIATLTMIVAAGLGARKKVIDKVKTHGIDTIMIRPGAGQVRGLPGGDRSVVSLTAADADAILAQVPYVKQAAPVQNMRGIGIKYRNNSTTTTVFGVTPNWAEIRGWEIESGLFISEEDVANMARVCVIGQTLLNDLFNSVNPLGETVRIRNVAFTVKGVFKTKGASLGGGDRDNRIIIPLSTASRRLFNQTHLNQIMVQVNEISEMEEVAGNVTSLLRIRHRLAPSEPDDFKLRLPTDMIARATEISGTFTLLLALISGVSLLAGGFVIMNIMLLSVSERRGEIGLRKAVGARPRDIQRQFLIETVTVTFVGGAIGILLGFAGAKIVSLITQMPAAYSWEGIAAGVVFSTLVGLIAGMQPAKRASALDPIEALRS